MYAPAGSLVLWDNRIPHATADTLAGNDTREVIYTAFLPAIPLNIAYGEEQWKRLCRNYPPCFVQANKLEKSDRNFDIKELTLEQAKLLGATHNKRDKNRSKS